MKKIWIAIIEDYDDYDIVGLFTEREDAEKYVSRENNDNLVLYEYTVDGEYSELVSKKSKSDINDTIVFNGIAYKTTGFIKMINKRWHYELSNGDDFIYITK